MRLRSCLASVLLLATAACDDKTSVGNSDSGVPDAGPTDPVVRPWSVVGLQALRNPYVEYVVTDPVQMFGCDVEHSFTEAAFDASRVATVTKTTARTNCSDGVTPDATTTSTLTLTLTPGASSGAYELTVVSTDDPTPKVVPCTLKTNGLVCMDGPEPYAVLTTTGLPTSSTYERGEYLAQSLLGCADCHGNGERGLTGAFVYRDPNTFDGIAAPRLNWAIPSDVYTSLDQFADVVRTGVAAPNSPVAVVRTLMPYWAYANLSDADIAALYEYLTTAPPAFMGGGELTTGTTDLLPRAGLTPADIPMPTVVNAQTMNGRALAGLSGACVSCHTPETSFGVPDYSKVFAGGRAYSRDLLMFVPNTYPATIYSTNLTPHATGLEGWTAQQIVDVLLEGQDPDGNGVCLPMRGGQGTSHGGITASDAADIAAYLLALPPVDNAIPSTCSVTP